MDIFSIVILVLAGIGAGVATGFVGASAAIIITPILVLFMGYGGYEAVGIALATDVVASLVAAATYWRHGNIDIRRSLWLAIIAVAAALIVSLLFTTVADPLIVFGTTAGILFMALQLLRKPLNQRIDELQRVKLFDHAAQHPVLYSAVAGVLIGIIAGIFGAGGGMMILIILTLVLRYRVAPAIGTSVLVMVFIALFGAVGHFTTSGIPWDALVWTVSGAIIGSLLAAAYANRVSETRLSRIVGSTILLLGVFYLLRGISLYIN